jgi:hypothetical protein
MPSVDRRAVLVGAAYALAVALPNFIAFQVVDAVWGIGCDSNVNLLFWLVGESAWVLGGWRAARTRPEGAFANAALAVLAAYALVAAMNVAILVLTDPSQPCQSDRERLVSFAFNTAMAAAGALLGAVVALRTGRRRPTAP